MFICVYDKIDKVRAVLAVMFQCVKTVRHSQSLTSHGIKATMAGPGRVYTLCIHIVSTHIFSVRNSSHLPGC